MTEPHRYREDVLHHDSHPGDANPCCARPRDDVIHQVEPEQELTRQVEFAKNRIRYALDNGAGGRPLSSLLRWLERQYDELNGRPLRSEVVSKAMSEMQARGLVRVDGDRRVWVAQRCPACDGYGVVDGLEPCPAGCRKP